MVSNDIQIELEAEEGYTAIRKSQYAVNGAAAGLLMDFALSKNVPGLAAGDSAAFEKWLATQSALPAGKKKFLDEAQAFAKAKGSPIDLAKTLPSLTDQGRAIGVLVAFAQQKDPALVATDRKAVEDWYRTKAAWARRAQRLPHEVARFARRRRARFRCRPTCSRPRLQAFAATNVGQPTTVTRRWSTTCTSRRRCGRW